MSNVDSRTMDGLNVDANGLNMRIQSHKLPEQKMREIGFTDHNKDRWYYHRLVQFPKIKRYKGIEISFNVIIPKYGGRLRIDVLDEDYLQPYDYQHILEENNTLEVALIVKEFVEKQMEYLQDQGVLSGHTYGEYI